MKLYVCKKCGNVVLKLEDKSENLVCCNEQMELINVNSTDAAGEKHLPIYEIKDNVISIKVGEIEHPMSDEHFISFIILAGEDCYKIKKLLPTDKPQISFNYDEKYNKIYAYCNLHSLWVTEIK